MFRRTIAAAALALCGCAADDASLDDGKGTVIATVSDPLTSGSIRWLNGTYTGCTNRGGSWSARVNGNGEPMAHSSLSVVKNDSMCALRITAIVADATYAAAQPMTLGTSFAGSPVSFGAGASQIAVNARLDSGSFASDFQITLVHSLAAGAPVAVANSAVSGGYATVQPTSSTATLVAPPSYTLDVTGLRFQVGLVELVVGITAYAVLKDGLIGGSTYVVEGGALGATSTYAQIASAYDGAISKQKTITGPNPTIPAADVGILTLSVLGSIQVRNVIVKRSVSGIAAYQVIRVTFIS